MNKKTDRSTSLCLQRCVNIVMSQCEMWSIADFRIEIELDFGKSEEPMFLLPAHRYAGSFFIPPVAIRPFSGDSSVRRCHHDQPGKATHQ